ncbi:unnamed protein product [Kuraishia capsulata CBS 1993]|uniref:Uncharacterized protein n=1 Tax=Kuraishia capsulata CBS 1993 TaxID=1382522 RepID=W6MRN0_9ASCO|nr:uncharacterized protein KUCA_T00003882001 [Kuraishia capsulata CBS 1993]CDK27902.1 unnamed protein product [Kuraishia capsulata CBS 1993]
MASNTVFQINGLVRDLDSSEDPRRSLSHLAYYYPKVRNAANVTLLTDHLLSGSLWQNSDFLQLYQVLEFFKYASDTKFQISVPSLSFYDWYHSVTKSLVSHSQLRPDASWRTLPVLAGLLLSIDSRKDLDIFPPNYRSIDKLDLKLKHLFEIELIKFYGSSLATNPVLNNLANICIACNLETLPPSFYARLNKQKPDLANWVVQQMFCSEYGLDSQLFMHPLDSKTPEMRPNVKHLNRLALLIRKLVENNDGDAALLLKNMDFCLNKIQTYSECLRDGPWNETSLLILKNGYYATILITETIFHKFFTLDARIATTHFPRFSRKILTILYFQNFVLNRIGDGGFESFNFVVACCIDGLKQDAATSKLVQQVFDSNIDFGKLVALSEVEQGKLLFSLETTGKLINHVPVNQRLIALSNIDGILEEKTFQFTNFEFWKPVVEACHSVKLIFYNIVFQPQVCDQDIQVIMSTIIPYSQLLVSHFPKLLSMDQLQIGLINLATCVSPSSIVYDCDPSYSKLLTNLFFNKCASLPQSQIRVDFISAFISIIPLVPVECLTKWIEITLRELIFKSDSKAWRRQLVERLWEEILNCNKVDTQKGQVGITWWYDNVNSKDVLTSLKL